MKNFVTIFIALNVIVLVSSCGPTKQEAFDYHQKIINEQHQVIRQINEMNGAFSSFQPDSIETALNLALTQTNSSIEKLQDMESLGDESKLRESCLDFFNVIKNQLENEYLQQLEIYKLPIDEYDTIQQNKFIELHKKIEEQYFPVFDKFAEAEENFAKEWGFELKPADL